MKLSGFILILLLLALHLRAQNTCTTLGQTPETAFPICAENVFHQEKVPICTNGSVFVPGCDPNSASDGGYTAGNPFWYRFTCFESGKLSILITPMNLNDDYDWQLYDITGLSDLSTLTSQQNKDRVVTGNWAGTPGETGANPNSQNIIQCASNPTMGVTTFAQSPNLVKGHNYLLLISHFTQSQSGYDLSFSGSTAVISDKTVPSLSKVTPSCDNKELTVQLNKELQCASLASDGSDFAIGTGDANVISATSTACSNSFGFTTVTLELDKALPLGNYDLIVKKGSDGNTLLDNCGTPVSENNKVAFDVIPPAPTLIDNISPVACAPTSIEFNMQSAISAQSISPDGSDFKITGPISVNIIKADGMDVNDGKTQKINITFSQPIGIKGVFTVELQQGSDGNTLLNECGAETPAGSGTTFQTVDTVNAEIITDISPDCNLSTITLSNPGENDIQSWAWSYNNETSNLQSFTYTDTTFDDQLISLSVSNGVCTDAKTIVLQMDKGYLAKADFSLPEFACPDDLITFTDESSGEITNWDWNFGNGNTSFLKSPPQQQYPQVATRQLVPVSLEIETGKGCQDTVEKNIEILNSCYIAVPSAFSPNGDGQNDYLYPLNAYKAQNLTFKIFDRWGKLVFETRDWTQKWDGTYHGQNQPIGSYVWFLEYNDPETGEKIFKKGATLLIR